VPQKIDADTAETTENPISRIFLSIAEHHGEMAPETRLQTIYPRYLEETSTMATDGLRQQGFRDGTPYEHEDLMIADGAEPATKLVARCSRDSETPGMCLSERRINGVDLTFRFPRRWLSHWRDVANAMDHLIVQLHGSDR
jgi:hypothetical protein